MTRPNDASPAASDVGRLIGDRYLLAERIGVGGMATVHRALDTRLDRWVAVKLLRREVIADTDIAMRFRREALAATVLRHPSIVACLEAGSDDGQPLSGRDGPGGIAVDSVGPQAAATTSARPTRSPRSTAPSTASPPPTARPTPTPDPTPKQNADGTLALCEPFLELPCGLDAGTYAPTSFTPPIRFSLGDGWSTNKSSLDLFVLGRDEGLVTFAGDASRLANFVEGDVVVMNVISTGSYSYDTQSGGNTTVPSFEVKKITRKGSCD